MTIIQVFQTLGCVNLLFQYLIWWFIFNLDTIGWLLKLIKVSLQFDRIQSSHEMIKKPLLEKVKIVLWEIIASNMNITL